MAEVKDFDAYEKARDQIAASRERRLKELVKAMRDAVDAIDDGLNSHARNILTLSLRD